MGKNEFKVKDNEKPYLVVSDIHGDENGVYLIEEACRRFEPEAILSAGDQCPELYNPFYGTLTMVSGNSDRPFQYEGMNYPPRFRELSLFSHRTVICHGHDMSSDDFDLKKGDIFIFGHTHVPLLRKVDGIYYLNPGSPSYPRSSEGATAALIFPSFLALLSLRDFTFFSSLKI